MRRLFVIFALLLLAAATPANALSPAFLFAWGSAGSAAGQFQSPHGRSEEHTLNSSH